MTTIPKAALMLAALRIGLQLRGRRTDAVECHLCEDSRTVVVEAFRGDESVGTAHIDLPQPTAAIDYRAWQACLMHLFCLSCSQFSFGRPVAFSLGENPDARDTPN